MKRISTNLGWAGTVLIVLAYALVSFSLINSDTLIYQALNLFGAVGIVVDTFYKKDKPPMVLNIIWAIIALVALFKILIR